MKPGFHLFTAASFTALIGVVACGPQNVPQPQRVMGPGIINPMANQQMLMNQQMQMRTAPPLNTNTNTTTSRTTPPPLPQKPVPVPVPAPVAESAEIKRNFELASSIESAHLIHLKGSTFRLLVQVAGFPSPHDVIISLNGKVASDGLLFELKQVASRVATRRVLHLDILLKDQKAKVEVIFEIARAEFTFKNSDIFEGKKGAVEAKDLSKNISDLVSKNTAIATMSYSWIQNPRKGLTPNNSLVSGVDFALIDGDDVLIGLSHTNYDAFDRISGDNVSRLAVHGGKLLEKASGLVMAERGFRSSKIIADQMTIKVSIQEQTVELGFREAAKTVIIHVPPSLK